MKRKPPAPALENCSRCPAFVDDAGATVSVGGFAVVPGRLAAQVTDGVWNAVVTTPGKGTFMIRCPKDRPAHACPLRAYEVRHVAAEPPPSRNRMKKSRQGPKGKAPTADLFVRILAEQA